MARKAQFTEDDDALLAELGVEVEENKSSSRSPREERIIAGFEDIERFYEQHGQLPTNGEDKDIFERLYAVRLDKIRTSEDCRAVLAGFDKHGLLQGQPAAIHSAGDDLDDDALLAELGVLDAGENDITKLTHVKTRAEIRAAEEIAKRASCLDFDKFKPLFTAVQEDLKVGIRQSRRFKEDASIEKGEFFILGGQIVYVAEVGEEIKAPNGATDARLRVIYDNGTESDLLMRSLQRALYKDEAGRRVTDPSAGPLFSDVAEDGDIESGTIYILRSKSDHPLIKEHRDVIHKIGVTSGDISKRLSNAKLDPTFLMADVEVVATYELSNINRVRLEKLIHKFFEPARLNIEIKDRFGNPIVPREWFLVPRFVIDEAVEKIKDGSIVSYIYDAEAGKIGKRR
ncbi:MAG: GIY-YIG nuclease family protein [Alphaproteobacteria bacterium]|nr:GIY-YIG nuclease family protein [Alphaproteobacteria bacterium]